MEEQLFDQAVRLYDALNRAAYQRLWAYARLPYYDRRVESDRLVLRLNRMIGRAERRKLRRLGALLKAEKRNSAS